MSDMREEMLRTLDRVVADLLTTAERERADNGEPSAALWSALVEQGMTELGETGSEIPFADAMALVRRAGYHAAPVPLAETKPTHPPTADRRPPKRTGAAWHLRRAGRTRSSPALALAWSIRS